MNKATSPLKICIDDGSSFLKYGIVSNEYKGDKFPSFAKRVVTFNADNSFNKDCFSFENNAYVSILASSSELVSTDSIEYQYSDINLALISKAVRNIIEALPKSERPKEIELSVTLPTDLFANKQIIQKKKDNLEQLATCPDGFELPVIKNINVYPEAISAFYGIHKNKEIEPTEQTLILDFGGATIGICVIEGNEKIIHQTEIRATEYSGTIPISKKLGNLIASDFSFPSVPLPAAMKTLTDGIFNKKDYSEFIASEVNKMYEQALEESNRLANINFIDNVYIVGGGANLINKYVDHKYDKIENPEYLNLNGMCFLEDD